ncbi:hypothetical protein KEM55_000691 [Ascosphaera atra]|nr:hypothetical protein KEM55_000691 [Ascosphaera atra]
MLDSAIATAAASTLSLSLSLSLLSVDSSWGDWCFGSTADQQSRDAAHVLLRPGYEMLVSLQLLANGFHAPLLDNLARDAARTCVRDRKAKKAVYANDCHSHFSAPRAPEDLPAESTLAIAARILHDFFAEPKCNSPRLGETLARCRGNGNGGYPYWAASSNIRSHKKKKPTKKQQAYARKQQAGGRSERGTGEGARQSSGRAPGDDL